MFTGLRLLDFQPGIKKEYEEAIEGLRNVVKQLPSKFFYDERGSQLFDEICTLPEYYPTRVEQAIMDNNIGEIAGRLGKGCLLIELGSGSSKKTRTLLDHLPDLAGYAPVDISGKHLMQSAKNLAKLYPNLEILPVVADYESQFQIPVPDRPILRRMVYFPGSTVGNFHPQDAAAFLHHIQNVAGPNSEILIGVDLKKDTGLLHRAYNDCEGVTAAFNLNILTHLNREAGANFNLNNFKHKAFYNEGAGRIEMHLVSLKNQIVQIGGDAIYFKAGEYIWTESSYKYTLEEFGHLAQKAGLTVSKVWTDQNNLFSVQHLIPTN